MGNYPVMMFFILNTSYVFSSSSVGYNVANRSFLLGFLKMHICVDLYPTILYYYISVDTILLF